MELSILYILSTADGYKKYISFIPKHLVSKETHTVMTDMREWFNFNTSINWKDFSSWFKMVRHAAMKPEVLELYDMMFTKMDGFTPTGTDMETIHALIGRDYAVKIAELAGDVADGAGGDLTKIDKIMDEWKRDTNKVAAVDSLRVTEDIHEIMEAVIPTGGRLWRLPEMNLSLGPIRKGDFITLGARPDTGKTSFLASEVTFIAEQMIGDDQYVLWFCNEEIGRRVKYRIIQSCLAVKTAAFIADYEMHHANYISQMGGVDRIQMFHSSTLSIQEIELVVHEYRDKVGLIVFDQLHKFYGIGNSNTNDVARQALLFGWARGMAEYAPVLNVHQVKGTGAGVMFLEMDQLYGSTTLIQGECDAVVMLGRSFDEKEYPANARGLYAPKNKLIGDLTSDGKYRNAKFEITFQSDVARFKGAF